MNVLLIGEKGVGKSMHVLDTFKRNKLKYSYFSGATLDPWIHLLGIPKAKKDETTGKEKMEFILPENLDDDVEAIFCDEWNRTHKTVRNALLELQQFKSINGRKFPNLKIIWGAVNPAKKVEEDADYDVEELDPAQLDRFHIIVELPNSPSLSFFKKKYGDYRAKILCDWWAKQPKEALKILSPRRLDYIGESFLKGLDIKYLLPESANVRDLVQQLSTDETVVKIKQLFANPTDEAMKEFLSNDDNFLKCKNELQNSKYWTYWKHINKEFISQEMKQNTNFENYVIYRYISGEELYKDIVDSAIKTDNNYKIGSPISQNARKK